MSMVDVIRGEARRMAQLATTTVRKVLFSRCDADGWSQWEGYQDEIFDEVELWQQYGFASRPTSGEALLAKGLTGESAVAFATVDRNLRPDDLETGEARVYGPDNNAVRMRSSGSVDINCKSGQTVNVGGSSESILLGDTVIADLSTFADAVAAATTPGEIAAAGAALKTAIVAGWASSKGKVT